MSDEQVETVGGGYLRGEISSDKVDYSEYLRMVGGSLKRFRNSLPRDIRSLPNFGTYVGEKWLGKPIDRNRLARVEEGELHVAFGVYVAILGEMGLLPAMAELTYSGDRGNLRYIRLLGEELQDSVAAAKQRAADRLDARLKKEKRPA